MAITGSRVAKNVFDTKGANTATTTEIARTIKIRIRKDALIYSFAFSCSPRAKCSETKFTEPFEIPISAREARIATRFKAAEKIPKSYTEKARATKRVKRKLQKADITFPEKSTKVSLAVAEKTNDLALS